LNVKVTLSFQSVKNFTSQLIVKYTKLGVIFSFKVVEFKLIKKSIKKLLT